MPLPRVADWVKKGNKWLRLHQAIRVDHFSTSRVKSEPKFGPAARYRGSMADDMHTSKSGQGNQYSNRHLSRAPFLLFVVSGSREKSCHLKRRFPL